MRIYVSGIGNPWASDDGIGPELVRRLQTKNHRPAGVTFVTLTQPMDLLDLIEECDVLMVVDAVVSGAPPGTVHCQVWLPGLLSAKGVERASSHGLGVHEVLNLAAQLGRLPAQVILWGVEVASTEPGQGLSPDATAAVPTLVERLDRELTKYNQREG
jgi:hydrogenase maturation protease